MASATRVPDYWRTPLGLTYAAIAVAVIGLYLYTQDFQGTRDIYRELRRRGWSWPVAVIVAVTTLAILYAVVLLVWGANPIAPL